MARKSDIRLRRSNVANAVPGSADLNEGELAINTADGALYFKKSDGTIITGHDDTILHIDSAYSRVGIGTSSPTHPLDIHSGTGDWSLRALSTDAKSGIVIADNNTANYIMSQSYTLSLGNQPSLHAANLNIKSTGLVGVGIINPALQSGGHGLHIHDDANSEIKFTNDTTGASASDGTALVTSGSSFSINNREAGLLHFGTSNTTQMSIDASGRVGIGTTNPSSTFQVEGTGDYLANFKSSDAASGIKLTDSSSQSRVVNISGHLVLVADANNNSSNSTIRFNIDTASVAASDSSMILTSTGLGIGTTSPQAKLNIQNATAGTAASVVAAGTSAGIYLEDDQTPTDNYFVSKVHNPGNDAAIGGIKFAVSPDATNYSWAGIKGLTSTAGSAGNLAFYTSASNTSGDSSTERMRINSSGNVGIGTNAPLHKLAIGGNSTATLKSTVAITDMTNGASLALRGQAPTIFFDSTSAGIPTILMDGRGIEFKDGTLDSQGNVDAKIDASGRLLLNATTTAFSDKLYVNGNAYATGGWRIGTSATYTGKIYNSSGIMSIETDSDRDIQFGDSGTPAIMYIDTSTENVGIGTSSPSATLEVSHDNNSTVDIMRLRNGDSLYSQSFLFQLDTSKDMVITGASGSGGIKFVPGTRGVTVSNKLVVGDTFSIREDGTNDEIKSTGNVLYVKATEYSFQDNSSNERISINSSGAIEFNNAYTFPTSIGSAGQILKVPSSGTQLIWASDAGGGSATILTDNDGDTKIQVEESADEDIIRFDTAGSQRMVILANGNVGINNTSPNAKLTVSGSTLVELPSSSNTFKINDSQNSVERFRVTQAGNVGIGTSSPSATLHIQNASTNGEVMRLTTTGDDPDRHMYFQSDHIYGSGNMYFGTGAYVNLFRASSHRFYYGSSNTEAMRVHSNGNVGIGTTSPGRTLDVDGTVRIDGGTGVATTGVLEVMQNGDDYDSGISLTSSFSNSHRIWKNSSGVLNIGSSASTTALQQAVNGNITLNAQIFKITGASPYIEGTGTGAMRIKHTAGQTMHIRPDQNGQVSFFEGSAGGSVYLMTATPTVNNTTNDSTSLYFQSRSKTAGGVGQTSTARIRARTLNIATNESELLVNGVSQIRLAGNTVVDGNLTVNGTQTILNTSTLSVDDLNITVADGAANAAAANGAGLTVAGAAANIVYESTNDRWTLNKEVFAQHGFMIGTTSTDVGLIKNSLGVLDFQAQSGRQISFSNVTNGEHVRIDADGKVGIGTTSPSQKLHVTGNLRLESTFPKIEFVDTDNNPDFTIIGGSGRLGFYDETNSTERVRINASGNVGIGTDSPSRRLDVRTGVFNSSIAQFTGASDGRGLLISTFQRASNDDSVDYDTPFGGHHTFSASGAEKVRITNTGSVGIGTSSPPFKLSVDSGTSDYPAHFKSTDNKAAIIIADDDTTIYVSAESNRASLGHNPGLHANNLNVMNTGDVGIGTSSPTRKLQVKGTGNTAIAITSPNTDYVQLALGDTDDDNYAQLILDNASNKLQIQNGGGGVVGDRGITLDSSENVGIGTDSPSAKLDVNGTTKLGTSSYSAGIDTITDGSLVVPQGSRIVSQDAAGNNYLRTIFAHDTATSNYVFGQQGTSLIGDMVFQPGSTGNFRVFASGSEDFRVASTGRVGIGTTSPYYQLDTRFSDTTTALSGGSSGEWGSNGIRIDNTNATVGAMALAHFRVGDADWHIGNKRVGTDQADFIFANEGATKMLIDHTGKVGIGTDSPYNTLHVNGTSRINSLIVGDANATNTPAVALHIKSSATNARLRIEDSDSSNDYWDFYVNQGDGLHFQEDGANRVTFKTGGNVGIGTTDPTEKLHIHNGSMYVTPVSYAANADEWALKMGAHNHAGWDYLGIKLRVDSNGSPRMSLHSAASTEVLSVWAGKVGIGVNNPGQKLTVGRSQSDTFSNTHLGLKATSTTNTTGRTAISMATSTVNNYGVTLNAMRKGTDGVPTFGINMHNNSAGGLEALTITAAGNVGIGTSSPNYSLDIDSSTASMRVRKTGNDATVIIESTTAGAWTTYKSPNYYAGALHTIAGVEQWAVGNLAGQSRWQIRRGRSGAEAFSVQTDGKVGINNSAPNARFQVEEYGIDTTTSSTAATTQVAIHTFPIADFRSARLTIQITNTTDSTYHSTEILAIHDGTTANITEFGEVHTGSSVEATFDADVSGGNFRLLATPTSTNSMAFKVVCHSLTV